MVNMVDVTKRLYDWGHGLIAYANGAENIGEYEFPMKDDMSCPELRIQVEYEIQDHPAKDDYVVGSLLLPIYAISCKKDVKKGDDSYRLTWGFAGKVNAKLTGDTESTFKIEGIPNIDYLDPNSKIGRVILEKVGKFIENILHQLRFGVDVEFDPARFTSGDPGIPMTYCSSSNTWSLENVTQEARGYYYDEVEIDSDIGNGRMRIQCQIQEQNLEPKSNPDEIIERAEPN